MSDSFPMVYGAQAGAALTTQYRMLPAIGEVVSTAFYDGRLEHGRSKPEVPSDRLPRGLEKPLTWITTDGLGENGEERFEDTGTSRINPAEADVIIAILKQWARHASFVSWATEQTKHAQVIGVICMYAAQRDLVRKKGASGQLSRGLSQDHQDRHRRQLSRQGEPRSSSSPWCETIRRGPPSPALRQSSRGSCGRRTGSMSPPAARWTAW